MNDKQRENIKAKLAEILEPQNIEDPYGVINDQIMPAIEKELNEE